MSEIDGKSRVVTVTPVLSLTAYADGDQMGSVLTLENMFDTSGDTLALQTLAVLDKSKQNSSIDILFFKSSPTVASVDNAPLDISDAEMAAKFVGKLSLLNTSYSDLANSSIANINNLGILCQSVGGGITSLYCILQCRGTPTYTSASDLVLNIGAFQD